MVEYKDITPAEIELIKDLWNKNKEYHERNEKVFKEMYSKMTFEERMKGIFEKGGECKITIAKEGKEVYGYSISNIVESVGEVVSLHVLESRRKKGIGKKLTELHIDWMKKENCKEIGLYVACVNESTIKFYQRLGLHPNYTYMQLKPEFN